MRNFDIVLILVSSSNDFKDGEKEERSSKCIVTPAQDFTETSSAKGLNGHLDKKPKKGFFNRFNFVLHRLFISKMWF